MNSLFRLARLRPILLALVLFHGTLFALPSVPGFQVQEYATVTDPIRLCMDDDGNIYAGRDNSGSGGSNVDAVPIHKIGPGGAPVVTYGLTSVSDPDAVVVDRAGLFGPAGSVLVGGVVTSTNTARISRINPDQSVVTLFGPSSDFWNPTDLLIDDGRLLFTNHDNHPNRGAPGIYMSDGPDMHPVLLVETNVQAAGLCVDSQGRMYLSTADGKVHRYAADGTLLDADFVVDPVSTSYAAVFCVGQLGMAAEALYLINSLGELLCVTDNGLASVMGSGFTSSQDLLIDEQGRLLVSEFSEDRILICSVVASPTINIAWQAGLLELQFEGILQECTDPFNNNWMDVDPQPGTGTLSYDPASDEGHFWRARTWAGCTP